MKIRHKPQQNPAACVLTYELLAACAISVSSLGPRGSFSARGTFVSLPCADGATEAPNNGV